MHDFAAFGIINAAVIASSLSFHRALRELLNELIAEFRTIYPGPCSLREDVIGRLDSLQTEMRNLIAEHSQRITKLEQHKS